MQKIVKLNQAFLYCCMVVMFCLHSQGYAAPTQGKPVSLNIKNSTLAEILRQVSKKSGLYIYFQDADLAAHKNVTIDVRNKPVENVLHELLDGRGLSWVEVSENTIAVKKKLEAEDRRIEGDTVATITVTGKVVNEKGEPVIGATVVLKGDKMQGTTTNAEGEFLLERARPNTSIVVSSVSYLTQEVALRGRQIVGEIKLKEYVGELDETVVIAYGTTSRRKSTGNFGSIKAKDIAKQPIQNPLLALQGRVAGLQITQATGSAGSGVSVIIQGQNSFFNGNDPFYVIDGVPYSSQLLPNLGNVLGTSRSAGLSPGQNGNPLSFINPSDIESIEVLKDADATAIYGSRAANGAILITTKKGKAGKTKIDINLQKGIADVKSRKDLLTTDQYLEMRREAKENGNSPIGPSDYDLNGDWEPKRFTNWQKELIGNQAQYTDAQITISGGNLQNQFLVGAGYHKETSVFPGDFSDKKASLHFSMNNSSLNEKFHFSLSGNYLVDNNELPTLDLTSQALTLAPNAPSPSNPDGSINWAPNSSGTSTWEFDNPLAFLLNNYSNKTNNLVSSANISYQIFSGLEVSSNFGYTNMQSNEMNTETLNSIPPEYRSFFTRKARYGNNNINTWIIEPQVSYSRIIANGKLTALIGSTIQQNNSSRRLLEGRGYNSDLILDNINAATSIVVPENSTISSVYKYNALFGRVNYNWEDKYIMNFTFRRDGSSRFGSENRFHNFGALGVAWLFSNEHFIKNNVSLLSFGKIKGSYGTTGSDQIGDYEFMSLYRNNNSAVPYRGGTSLIPEKLPNPFLQWEKTKKLSLGVELGFLRDRLLFNLNYFRNRSSNQLLAYALPSTTGFGLITSNFPATVQNTGWELTLNTINIKGKEITWSTSFNITVPKNKIAEFKDLATSSYANEYEIGQPLSVARVYKFSKVDSQTGIYQFFDKEGKITSDPSVDPENKTIRINTAQTYYGGIQNSFSYKGFSLDVLFQFVKQKGLGSFYGNSPGATKSNQPTSVLNRWRKSGDIAPIQKYTTKFSDRLASIYVNESNAAWEDASFIRLKNLSLSWQMPVAWSTKIGLQNCRFYLLSQNLLTITSYSGLDAETRSSSTLPPLRVFTFGIQVTL